MMSIGAEQRCSPGTFGEGVRERAPPALREWCARRWEWEEEVRFCGSHGEIGKTLNVSGSPSGWQSTGMSCSPSSATPGWRGRTMVWSGRCDPMWSSGRSPEDIAPGLGRGLEEEARDPDERAGDLSEARGWLSRAD